MRPEEEKMAPTKAKERFACAPKAKIMLLRAAHGAALWRVRPVITFKV